MTLTRWKLLAGILGTAIVGVALADPKCPADQPKTHSSNQQRPRLAAAPEVVSTTVPATLPLPFAEVVDKGTAPPVTPPTPSVPLPSISMLPPNSAALPPINVAPAPVSVALPKVGESPVLLPPTTDLPRTTEPAKRELPTIDLPKLEGAKVAEAPKVELAPPASTLPSLPTNSAGLPGAKPPIPSLTTVPVPLAELPKVDLPKTELPKVELPKVELPKVELPKVELPKVELPPESSEAGYANACGGYTVVNSASR